jgi:spore germination protein GerM
VSRTPRLALAPAAALLLLLAACGDGDGGGGGQDGIAAPTASPTATPAGTPSTSPSPAVQESPDAPQASGAVAVYYLMDTTNGPRLYREFHQRPSTGEPVRDAVEAMLTVPPDDPDYTSLWPSATEVLGVEVDGGTATVDLSAEALEGSAGSEFEEKSVQQLVHTVTAADTSVRSVQLTFEGEVRESLWGAVQVDQPLSRAPQAGTLGPVWLLVPVEGASIARGAEFGGVATVFEATVNWQWLQDGRVVAEGFSTASEGAPGRGDWSAAVDVPPGTYELQAFESSAKDGSQTFVDSKRVTVTG